MSFEYVAARLQGERDAALAEVDQLHTDNHELVHRLFKAENSVSPLQAERDALQAEVEELKAANVACEALYFSQTDALADQMGALQARIDAAQPIFDAVRDLLANIALTGTYSRRGSVKALNDLAAAGAALGVDPQKETQR